MHRFMIGLYGGFDLKKYQRDFRSGFFGIEACLFSEPEEITRLAEESKRQGFQIGIHFPLRAGHSRLRDALFLSPDASAHQEAYAYIENELAFVASRLQPAYVLFHYPKPVILDDRVNWEKWRFYDASEYLFESTYSLEMFQEKSEALFQWLTEKSRQYGFVPILELDALNRYVYETDVLENLLLRYPAIKLCLDTGRLFWQEKIDPYFQTLPVISRYAKYAAVIHLWTMQVTEGTKVKQMRHPVLPGQSPEEGWAPIEQYLNIIAQENNQVRIMFEHQSTLVTDEQLDVCYAWVAEIFQKHAAAGVSREKRNMR
ncbi:sugar phosphate isomerase/epimerase [Brevibacillus ruminantium]|uniref:Sugar phosphate isomerase/epimerase n=1 Tax=Brevibacillus ruminantium TaxID=2950604 RepID=A0ABY4WCA4_9BACL|nr:sugar phosphate isomerase/epimerase [Brevibacillus ruminantium]USG64820.1 sugar phosphate isomerase/epimerase [Brevibacillus ruminantium]